MFKWIRRRRIEAGPVVDLHPTDCDSGEEEQASHEEDVREVAPSGLTRVKTDNV